MFDRILVPLDGSTQSESAIPFADRLPSKRVLLLFVEPPEVRQAGGPRLSPHAAATYLQRHAQTFRQHGRDVDTTVEFGDPAERIVELATEANLIVMATHARGSSGRLFYGDYADRVARHASAPTMLVRGRDHKVTDAGFERVLVPLDGSPAAEEALPVARRLASALSIPIQLIRIASPTDDGIVRPDVELYLRSLIPRLDSGMPIRWEVGHGDPASEIIGRMRGNDLVVLTTRGDGGVHRWCMGSVAERLVRRAPVPVLLIRDGLRTSLDLPASTAGDGWQVPGPMGGGGGYFGEPTPAG
jgi:nucleotide-binding universal stress UspA family protein